MGQNSRRNRIEIPLLFALLCIFTPTSFAALIDDFSTPQGPLTGVPDVVSGPGIIGGFRQASDPFFAVDGGVATFSFSFDVPGGTNLMGVAYDGTPEPSDGGAFAPLVDLTDGGAASHLLLGISEVTGLASVLISVTDVGESSVSNTFPGLSSPGIYSTPLPIISTGPDFTQVQRVDLVFFLSPLERSASVGVDFVCTGTLEGGCTTPVTSVPEPGTEITLAVLIAILPFLRRRFTPASTPAP